MIRAPIIIDGSGSVTLFATVNAAELHLEAIDVNNGEYVAYDGWGQILRLSTWKNERGIELVKIEGTSEYQSEELSQRLYESLLNLKKLPEQTPALSLNELIDRCKKEGFEYDRNPFVGCKIGALVVAAIIAMPVIGFAAFQTWNTGRPFDAAEWKNPVHDTDHVRAEMCDYLLKKEFLTGKTRAEVVKMLGEPPQTEYFSGYDLVYWLGPERGFIGIDSEWLVMRFDATGHVSECKLVTD